MSKFPKYNIRKTKDIPSLGSGIGNAIKKDINTYTGTKLLGIATMHKSNAVPVFSSETAEEIGKMNE